MDADRQINALKQAGYTKAEARRILEIIDASCSEPNAVAAAATACDLISDCSDATGGNAAFDDDGSGTEAVCRALGTTPEAVLAFRQERYGE